MSYPRHVERNVRNPMGVDLSAMQMTRPGEEMQASRQSHHLDLMDAVGGLANLRVNLAGLLVEITGPMPDPESAPPRGGQVNASDLPLAWVLANAPIQIREQVNKCMELIAMIREALF